MPSVREKVRRRSFLWFGGSLFLLVWLAVFLVKDIDLSTADLGRHIVNGRIILESGLNSEEGQNVLYKNTYSYTQPDHYFVNHHWASGVFFYLVWKEFGFAGLSLINILGVAASFLVIFKLAWKKSNGPISFLLALLVIPLIAERSEVRPEIFTTLFSSIIFSLLWRYKDRELPFKYLYIIPFLLALWVNLHLFFPLGVYIVGIFLLEQVILWVVSWGRGSSQALSKLHLDSSKKLLQIFILSCAALLINPWGIKGAIYPFLVANDISLKIVELQSIPWGEQVGMDNPAFLLFRIVVIIFLLAAFFRVVVDKEKPHIALYFFAVSLAALGYFIMRNISYFGLLIIPIAAHDLWRVGLHFRARFTGLFFHYGRYMFVLSAVFIMAFTLCNWYYYFSKPGYWRDWGIGLAEGTNESADFFKERELNGPIFNDFNISSYLIYHLYPKEKVYVDQRPEAYSPSFFKEEFLPALDEHDFWNSEWKKYGFKTIFISNSGMTERLRLSLQKDDRWEKIYQDDKALIYVLKDTGEAKSDGAEHD